ncbi:hypothetical protein V5G28_002865, partial [Scytonema sp. PRP1]
FWSQVNLDSMRMGYGFLNGSILQNNSERIALEYFSPPFFGSSLALAGWQGSRGFKFLSRTKVRITASLNFLVGFASTVLRLGTF